MTTLILVVYLAVVGFCFISNLINVVEHFMFSKKIKLQQVEEKLDGYYDN